MSIELVDANVVVVARQFNPSVLSQLWLVRKGLVGEEDFREGCIFTEALAQVNTDEFNLLVVPPRAQFSTHVDRQRQQQLIVHKMGGLVYALPETPYRAVGINLTWQMIPDAETISDLSRRLAFVRDSQVHRMFDSEDARFGAFLSRDSLGCRLLLSVKPEEISEGNEVLSFAFNYHRDIGQADDAPQVITEVLARWNEALEETSEIARAAEEV